MDIYAISAKVGAGDHLGWVINTQVNGEWKEALVDTGCARTLVRDVQGDELPKLIHIRCMHRHKLIWSGGSASRN